MQGEADVTVEHISRMNIQQFRHFISNAKMAGGGFAAEKADESFAAVAPLCRVCLRSLQPALPGLTHNLYMRLRFKPMHELSVCMLRSALATAL